MNMLNFYEFRNHKVTLQEVIAGEIKGKTVNTKSIPLESSISIILIIASTHQSQCQRNMGRFGIDTFFRVSDDTYN